MGDVKAILDKWDTGNQNCTFRHYFYNKVDEQAAPYYRPGPGEDPKEWEEALSKKPGPGYVPVLCTGFTQMGERIKIQQRNLATFNQKLHEINSSLDAMLSKHDLSISVRTLDARRKHTMLQQRYMKLIAKAQILRNRGFSLGPDEEDLKAKLTALERNATDPGLSARAEEIWARMVGVRSRARMLQEEIGKRAVTSEGLNAEAVRRCESVRIPALHLFSFTDVTFEQLLELYGQQLAHLKKEMGIIQEDYKEWEKEQGQVVNGR
jgi:nuclear pore complex protein Nup54